MRIERRRRERRKHITRLGGFFVGWPERWAHVKVVTWRVLMSDMTIVRVSLGIASLMCAMALWMRWEDYDRDALSLLRQFIGPDALGVLFFMHFIGVVWRLFGKESRRWGIAVNSLGFVLFAGLGIVVDIALRLLTLTSTVVLVVALLSFWAVARTGNGVQEISP